MPGLNWICGGPAGGSGVRRRMSGMPIIIAAAASLAVRRRQRARSGRAGRPGCPSPGSCAAGRSARRRRRPARPGRARAGRCPWGSTGAAARWCSRSIGRCHGLAFSQKYTGMPSAAVISACSAISLPWSQVSDRRSCGGSWPERGDQRVADRLGGVPAGQVQQDRVPRCPVHQGADRGPVGRAGDQVALPVPGVLAAGGLGGPLIDHGHGGDPVRAALARPAVRPAPPPAGAQRPGRQLAGQPAQLGAVDRLVDRLVHDMPRRRHPGNSRRSAWLICSGLHRFSSRPGHELPQHRITRRSCPAAAGPAAARPACAR